MYRNKIRPLTIHLLRGTFFSLPGYYSHPLHNPPAIGATTSHCCQHRKRNSSYSRVLDRSQFAVWVWVALPDRLTMCAFNSVLPFCGGIFSTPILTAATLHMKVKHEKCSYMTLLRHNAAGKVYLRN